MNPASCEIADSGEAVGSAALQCALCGLRFVPRRSVCASCPLSNGCDLARCPHCGYQFPRGSRILNWIRRRFAKGRS